MRQSLIWRVAVVAALTVAAGSTAVQHPVSAVGHQAEPERYCADTAGVKERIECKVYRVNVLPLQDVFLRVDHFIPRFPYNVNAIIRLGGSSASLSRHDIMTIAESRVGIISLRVFRPSSRTVPGHPLQSWVPGITITRPLGYQTLLHYVGGAWVPVNNRNVTQAGLYKWSRV